MASATRACSGGNVPRYYCELIDIGATSDLAFTYTLDGATFVTPNTAPFPMRLSGAATLTIDHVPPAMHCEADIGTVYTVDATIPTAITPDHVELYTGDEVLAYHYFAQIHTQ
jgi:hypothetical protein